MNINREFSLESSKVVEHSNGTLFDVREDLVVPALTIRDTALHKPAIVHVNKKTGAVLVTRTMS